jgi:hypothetical protein
MRESTKDAGTIQVLLERLNSDRLPRALALKAKVDKGERLEDHELQFLEGVFQEIGGVQGLINRHPEYQDLVGRLASLYAEITGKALENEKNPKKPTEEPE